MVNNEERIRKLTCKYFINQKLNEILNVYSFICGIVFVPFLLGILFDYFFPYVQTGQVSLFYSYFSGLMIGLSLLIIFMFFWIIYDDLKEWIKSNWKTAKAKALKEIK